MNTLRRVLLAIVFFAIIGVSLFAVTTATPPSVRQRELITEAETFLTDGIYVLARPLLQDAAAITGDYTFEAQRQLKRVHLALNDHRSYTNLLQSMMASRNATPLLFLEAAEYFASRRRTDIMFEVLQEGVTRFSVTDDGFDKLDDFYESVRYVFELGRNSFDDVTLAYQGFIQVMQEDLWGVATFYGNIRIPCIHHQASTVSQGQVITIYDNTIHAVNLANQRVALLDTPAQGIGNISANRIPIMRDGAWVWSTGMLEMGQREYEALGMYSGGYAAAKMDGRWGLIDINQNPVIPFEHDGIAQDELGRAVAQNAVFIRENNGVVLFINNRRTDTHFQDAHPFTNTGYAAVKQNDLWGFINASGEMIIEPRFADARSFSQHLAAVKVGNYWGYISLRGEVVIEPMFLEARGFYRGSAPVLTVQGWRFITLLEYRRRIGL